jgi:2-polyprenyl-6-methoxyphenol hydroxylase-like FAD-dependent oxidoreductase
LLLLLVSLLVVVPVRAVKAQKTHDVKEILVAGAASSGIMAALASARSLRDAGIQNVRIRVVDKRSKERSRRRWVTVWEQGAINMEKYLGFDLTQRRAEQAYDNHEHDRRAREAERYRVSRPRASRPSASRPQPIRRNLEVSDRFDMIEAAYKDARLSESSEDASTAGATAGGQIASFEEDGYEAIKRWNAKPGVPQIRLEFDNAITAIEGKGDGRLEVRTEKRKRPLRPDMLIVADGGREVTQILTEVEASLQQLDRGVVDSYSNFDVRLRWASNPIFHHGGTTVALVGEALTTGHWKTGANISRASTDAIALARLIPVLFDENPPCVIEVAQW